MDELKTSPWDVRDHLKSDEDCRLYLEACFAEAPDDPAFLARAIAKVACARTVAGASPIADENPSFAAAIKLLRALGLQLQATPTG
ncbi:MAG: hypothetical protein MUE46_10530 [Xanthomonadales bacterium]|jgi:DNA-binding phage protein|nr:hypothetical protein [Xanthomonadales bacterium]